jgi:DNA (cytosine-5)-methyltransferase 1
MKVIDLFAGAGGSTTGAAAAGCRVLWAANHWPEAVEIHGLNHPEVRHVCQDLHQANWMEVPAHDLMLASPCCQGHSKARGKENRATHDASRSTAWAPVSCAEFHRAPFFIIENVAEFQEWVLVPAWKTAMEALGYSLSFSILDAADFGVPQHRIRLFIIGSRSKNPINLNLEPFKKPLVSAKSVIDFAAGNWSLVNKTGRSPNTIERIANGRRQFGERFVAPYYSNGSGKTGRCLSRPIGTITTRDRWAVVNGDHMRMLTKDEYRAFMGFPAEYRLPATKKDTVFMLGNAVCPPEMEAIICGLKAAA